MSDLEAIAAALRDHQWTGRPGALCARGWANTTHVHGIHEDHRRHVATAILTALPLVVAESLGAA